MTLAGQGDQFLPEFPVSIRTRLLSVTAAINLQQLASPTLTDVVFGHDECHILPLTYKLQPFFSDHRFQRFPIQAEIGNQLLQAPILVLQILTAVVPRSRPCPVLALPGVQGRFTDAQLPR